MNTLLAICSFVLSVISVITVIVTIRQNTKMLESTSRPYISVYGESFNAGSPMFYLVIKNFGASQAVIRSISFDPSLSNCYRFTVRHDYLNELNGASIAPGQSRICLLDYEKVPDVVKIDIEYSSSTKTYKEHMEVNLTAGVDMPTNKVANEGKELRTISYTLQEMLQKRL